MKKNTYTSILTPEEKDAIVAAFITVPAAPAVKAISAKGKICACGCAGMTKGGTYLPGHDSKHKAMMAGGIKSAPKLCGCGCGGWTKGGTFRPGHDAKLMSSLIKGAQETGDRAVIAAAVHAAAIISAA